MKLICYLSNGYPSIEASVKMAREYVSAGCDIIEVDFPSKNPYLESDFIKNRMKAALEANDNYEDYKKGIEKIKEENKGTKFIILAYENTILEIGVDAYADFLTKNGFNDIIYVGNEHRDIKQKLIDKGILVSCYVQFHQPKEEVEEALMSNGFVYVQAKPAPGQDSGDKTLKECIQNLRNLGVKREIYAGVGIYEKEDIQMAREAGADGVFVGSTILKLHDDLPKMKEKISEFSKAAKGE